TGLSEIRATDTVIAYCDGSISPSTLPQAHSSHIAHKVGRVMCIIPGLDVGLIAQYFENLSLPNGHENALGAEMKAIEVAHVFCNDKKLERFTIYSDNQDAIERVGLPNVEHLPWERLSPADEYFYSMLSCVA